MVEKFGFTAAEIALMFLANMAANIVIAPQIGKLIARIGERSTLSIEYFGLILVFVGYALVESAAWAVALYILDHLFLSHLRSAILQRWLSRLLLGLSG